MSFVTDLFQESAYVPNPYIEINERTRNNTRDKGAILVKFDWDNHTRLMSSIDDRYQQYFKGLLIEHFRKYGAESYADMNKLINDSLLSMRVTLTNTLGGSSASIMLENFDNRWVFPTTTIPELSYAPIFIEGMYVTIDAKGRFNTDRYYRIFTGVLIGFSYVDNPVDRSMTLNFSDYSRFLRYTRYNTHPAVRTQDILAHKESVTIWTTTLVNKTNTEIASVLIPDKDKDWGKDKVNIDFKEVWANRKIVEDDYQKGISTSLGDVSIVKHNFAYSYLVTESNFEPSEYYPQILIWGEFQPSGTKKYTIFEKLFGNFSLFTDEFKTRQELLSQVAVASHFVCFIDGSGNIHFHPPRYDYIFKDTYPYTIPLKEGDKDDNALEPDNAHVLLAEESLSESYSQNEDSIVTRLWLLPESDYGIFSDKRAIYPNSARVNIIWADGIQKYGLREKIVSTAAFQSLDQNPVQVFALATFLRLFLERKKLTTTMPMRPELQVDRPFYVVEKKMIYHIASISHSYTAGGDRSPGIYTTTVDCFAGRPLSQATLLVPNLFKDYSLPKLIRTFKDAGFNIGVNAYEKKVEKKEGK